MTGVGPGGYRPEFIAALELLARALTILRERGESLPILVGGAVVELDTRSAVFTGDLDLQGGQPDAIAAALRQVGFLPEDREGWKRGGYYHPHLAVGVELVSGALFDGQADRARVRLVAMEGGEIPVPAVEDMIADRVGQWEASRRRDGAMLQQARLVYALAETLDQDYLRRRIAEETAGACGLDVLEASDP